MPKPGGKHPLEAYREGIETALRDGGGTHNFEDVLMYVQDGRARAWFGDNSVLITRLLITPNKRILYFWLAAGELEEVKSMVRSLCYNAEATEAFDEAIFIGRKGWKRILGPDGWKPTLTQYEKEL